MCRGLFFTVSLRYALAIRSEGFGEGGEGLVEEGFFFCCCSHGIMMMLVLLLLILILIACCGVLFLCTRSE